MISALNKRNTFSVGFMIALCSWAIMFFTLLWGYFVYRLRSGVWLDAHLDTGGLILALINTVIITASSWVMHQPTENHGVQDAKKYYVQAFILGFFFLVGQSLLWLRVYHGGLSWKSSIAGSFFFLLTGFHALHIVGGLAGIAVLASLSHYENRSSWISGIRGFWDFLLVVWGVMFVMIFIFK